MNYNCQKHPLFVHSFPFVNYINSGNFGLAFCCSCFCVNFESHGICCKHNFECPFLNFNNNTRSIRAIHLIDPIDYRTIPSKPDREIWTLSKKEQRSKAWLNIDLYGFRRIPILRIKNNPTVTINDSLFYSLNSSKFRDCSTCLHYKETLFSLISKYKKKETSREENRLISGMSQHTSSHYSCFCPAGYHDLKQMQSYLAVGLSACCR
jgi:hypothetical protein